MNLFMMVSGAARSLALNPLRSALASLGIVIGVSSVMAMMAVGSGARDAVENNFRALGSDNVRISTKNKFESGELVPVGMPVTYEDGLLLAASSDMISSVRMQATKVARARHGRSLVEIAITGATADRLGLVAAAGAVRPVGWVLAVDPTTDDLLEEGRYFSRPEVEHAADVCVLGFDTAEQLFLGEPAIGKTIKLGRRQCAVIGVIAELESTQPSALNTKPNEAIHLPISSLIQNFFDEPPAITLTAIVADESVMEESKLEIATILRGRHGIEPDADGFFNDDFAMATRDDILGAQQRSARTFSLLIAVTAGISLLVGGIGIMNVMLANIAERTREIGVRMAVGARSIDLIAQFLTEAIVISALGAFLGIGVGVLAIPFVARLVDGDAHLVPEGIPIALGVATITGVFFGIYPAFRAARLDPIEALRHE